MLSVSDILKILEQIPGWKTLWELPKRVKALEDEVATLKRALAAPQTSPGELCKACGAHAVRRTSTKPAQRMASLGLREEVWTCSSCGDVETKVKAP